MDRYDDALTLGVESMDSEHRHLTALFEEFVTCMKEGAQDRCCSLVEEALTATNEHFDTEERLMIEAGYPDVDEEKRQHRMLRLKLTTFVGDVLRAGACDPVTMENIATMQQLFYDHFTGADRDLANYLVAHGIR